MLTVPVSKEWAGASCGSRSRRVRSSWIEVDRLKYQDCLERGHLSKLIMLFLRRAIVMKETEELTAWCGVYAL